MTDSTQQTQSVSIEEYNKLKDDFTAQGERLGKLEKIFEERQSKVFDKNKAISKEELLKTLGFEKDPEKSELELVNERFTALNKTVEQLQADLKTKDEALALNLKKQKVIELAKPYNFIDVNDVLAVIDYTNDDIDAQLKNIAEIKKHWITPTNLGGAFNGGKAGTIADLEKQLQDAQNAGNVELAISLKRQMHERQK